MLSIFCLILPFYTIFAGSAYLLSLSEFALFGLAPLILIIVLAILFVLFSKRKHKKIIPAPPFKKVMDSIGIHGIGTGDTELDKLIADAGFAYNARDDIFYSLMYPWQRKVGYCHLYDEASATMAMVIDCEPVLFEYDGKRWMIELWKGQYGMTTGAEIGIYYTEGPDLDIPELFNGTFYFCADDADRLQMSFTLKKDGQPLFSRNEKHWWLTGFRLGEYSEPGELSLDAYITFKNSEMLEAFLGGLKDIGYEDDEYKVFGNSIRIFFTKTHTHQPLTRKTIGWIMQDSNYRNVKLYSEITNSFVTLPEKINAIRKEAPWMVENILNIGKPQKVFSAFDTLKKHLD